MKTYSLSSFLIFAFILILSSACNNDENILVDHAAAAPEISLVQGESEPGFPFITKDTVLNSSQYIRFICSSKRNASELVSFLITENGEPLNERYPMNLVGEDRSGFKDTIWEANFPGQQQYIFTVTAANGESASKAVNITTKKD